MAKRFGFILLVLISSTAAAHSQQAKPAAAVRKVPLTRTLKIATIAVEAVGSTQAATTSNAAALRVWPGAADEPPEGPAGFDVFDDGSVLIADPLLKRLALYDPQGSFKRAWEIGFAPDSVEITPAGLVLVREETTAKVYVFDREGNPQPGARPSGHALPQAQVSASRKSATLTSAGGTGSPGRVLTVQYDEPGSSLLSLEPLATDPDRGTFVAIEATVPEGGGDAISVKKMIRRYSPQGALICESSALPLDYYVLPVDEIRVRKGVAYQLMTTRNEVRIHEWDTNGR